MGYKSVLRSVGSAIRQAERESIRRQRLLEKQRSTYEKMQVLEQAAYDVDVYENYIERVTTLHIEMMNLNMRIKWKNIKRSLMAIMIS